MFLDFFVSNTVSRCCDYCELNFFGEIDYDYDKDDCDYLNKL